MLLVRHVFNCPSAQFASFVVAIAAALAPGALHAAELTQANGDPIPTTQKICDDETKTSGGLAAVFATRTCTPAGGSNLGQPCNTEETCAAEKERILGSGVTCETTWLHGVNDDACAIDPLQGEVIGLNPWTDVQTSYNTFRPLPCQVTFSVVSRGQAMFKDVFGWYNVDPLGKPAVDDLHVVLSCDTPEGAAVELDVQHEPAYKGGEIGYFLLTPEDRDHHKACDDGDCCASLERYKAGTGYIYYTQPEYNPEASLGGKPYVHFIGYDSRLTSAKFYFAWEDLYEPSGSDFTDVVLSVEGAECSGGGQPCTVAGAVGHCANGRTACKVGEVVCNPVVSPEPEACNGFDDDCNGAADDGAICPPSELCYQGRCQSECSGGEFRCRQDRQCDSATGLCVEPACVGVECEAGKSCFAGNCLEPCVDVVCPYGQVCLGNECVDLCAGVTCDAGKACVAGACVSCAECGGALCPAPLSCNVSTGACEDPSCTEPCPAGTTCSRGQCLDNCAVATARCPGGAECASGTCGFVSGAGGAGTVVVISGGSNGSAAAGPGGAVVGAQRKPTAAGCACSTAARDSSVSALCAALALAGALMMRRRKAAVCTAVQELAPPPRGQR